MGLFLVEPPCKAAGSQAPSLTAPVSRECKPKTSQLWVRGRRAAVEMGASCSH